MAKQNRNQKRSRHRDTSWDPLAAWYDGWVGEGGSRHHQELAIPAVLQLLELSAGESLLDVGAGQGVLAPYVAELGADYTGVDASPRLIQMANRRHSKHGEFVLGDARFLSGLKDIKPGYYDAVVFLLSIQDMDPLDEIFEAAAWATKVGGRIVILMTHPCFRIPRQSGWGWDAGRKLQFRRVDRYLTPLPVPLKPYPGDKQGVSRSFHRPMHAYINELAANSFLINQIREIPSSIKGRGAKAKAEKIAHEEIPLFLGVRAIKIGNGDS